MIIVQKRGRIYPKDRLAHSAKLFIRPVVITVTSGSRRRSADLAEPIVLARSNRAECETLYIRMHAAIKASWTHIFSRVRPQQPVDVSSD